MQPHGKRLLPLRRRFTQLNPPKEGRKAAFNRVNFEQLEAVWDERYQGRFGFWRPYVMDVIYCFLDCGDLH